MFSRDISRCTRGEAAGYGAFLMLEYQKSSVATPTRFAGPWHAIEGKSFNNRQSTVVARSLFNEQHERVDSRCQRNAKVMAYGAADDFWYSSMRKTPHRLSP